jgi:energy-coupling factor transporter ATP-binding protein EcfA2
MYLEHFQLKSQPFAEHAAVSSLWQDQRMDEGLARLDYLVRSGQLGLVTGPSGVGKSALLKRFLHGLLPPHCQAHYCHLSHWSSRNWASRHAVAKSAFTNRSWNEPRAPRGPCCWSSTRPICWTETP